MQFPASLLRLKTVVRRHRGRSFCYPNFKIIDSWGMTTSLFQQYRKRPNIFCNWEPTAWKWPNKSYTTLHTTYSTLYLQLTFSSALLLFTPSSPVSVWHSCPPLLSLHLSPSQMRCQQRRHKDRGVEMNIRLMKWDIVVSESSFTMTAIKYV